MPRLITIRDRDGAPVDVTMFESDDLAATIEWTDGSNRASVELTHEDAIRLGCALLFATDNRGPLERPDIVASANEWGAVFIAVQPEKRRTGIRGAVVTVLDPASVIVRAPKGS